jgi:hypothetical protein
MRMLVAGAYCVVLLLLLPCVVLQGVSSFNAVLLQLVGSHILCAC